VVGHEVRLKFLPELEFEEDEAIEQGRRIDELIERIHHEGGG
jgi:ribosome-binding factor A